VDVFTVRAVNSDVTETLWQRYSEELGVMLSRLQAKQHREVQGELAKRVAMAIPNVSGHARALLPVEIDIDNSASDDFTILRIDATDTLGFLYELTNALSLNDINILRVSVNSLGHRIHDTLFVTDGHGRKITDPLAQQQLRATTVLVKHFTHLLPTLPNPESALLHFHEFVAQLVSRAEWTRDLASIERPDVLEALAKLLGVSDFLWQDFLRMQHSNLFPVVEDLQSLGVAKTKAVLAAELRVELDKEAERKGRVTRLNAFKDREMFRIDMRYIQNKIPEFWLFAAELTHLGEVVLESAYSLCYASLRQQFGEPTLADGELCPISICALGKFGGAEIGFASDIELMFLYQGQGETAGPDVITNAEFVGKLVHEMLQTIKAKREGIFELDLRLRPYGKASGLGVTAEAFERYFAPDGPAWDYERQALVKMRPIIGDSEFGMAVLAIRDACLYTGQAFDVTAMHAMRQKQVRQLVTGGTLNAKFSPGALVDLEYLVQGLQITYGHDKPELRLQNTGTTLAALVRLGMISTHDYVELRDALDFLRRLIQGLRVVRGNAKDLTVPAIHSDEFAFLARRLGYESEHQVLMDDLNHYTGKVQELSKRLLG
jgi:glutamate-ammonia-ligase adenylyltransferase